MLKKGTLSNFSLNESKYLIKLYLLLILLTPDFLHGQYCIRILDGKLKGTLIDFRLSQKLSYCDLPLNEKFTAKIVNPISAVDLMAIDSVAHIDSIRNLVAICNISEGKISKKVSNVYDSGGKAIILINDMNDPQLTIAPRFVVSGFWSILISNQHGNLLKDSEEEIFNFVFQFEPLQNKDEVLWSENFTNSQNNWTSKLNNIQNMDPDSSVNWIHNPKGQAIGGKHGWGNIGSETVCDGAMIFNSDFFNNRNKNLKPYDEGIIYNCELISPPIDLGKVNSNQSLSLVFSQSLRKFTSKFFIGYSNDGGLTWKEIEINKEIGVNSINSELVKRIRLVGIKPSKNFQIKFRTESSNYFWIIDDVKIIKTENYNIALDTLWMTSAPYATCPLNLVTPIDFMTTIYNIGSNSMKDSKLSLTIYDDSDKIVYQCIKSINSVSRRKGTVEAGDTIKNVIIGNFLPDKVGKYKIQYKVSGSNVDFDTSDNTHFKYFTVTSSNNGEWGREDGINTNYGIPLSEVQPINWAYSSVFIPANDVKVEKVKYKVMNSKELGLAGASTNFFIYKCNDTNGDNIFTKEEYEIVGSNSYEFNFTENDSMEIVQPIIDFKKDEIIDLKLVKDQLYILSLVYTAPETSPRSAIYWAANNSFNVEASETKNEITGNFKRISLVQNPWFWNGPIDLRNKSSENPTIPIPYIRLILKTIEQ